jgi:hypothetical protein
MNIEYVGLSDEMINALQIYPYDAAEPHWAIWRIEIQPQTNNQSAFAVVDGTAPRKVIFSWPSRTFDVYSKADPYAPEGAKENAASMPMFAGWGSYSVKMDGPSDEVRGFGLYGDNLELTHTAHHPVLIYFKRVEGEEPEPEPEPPPPPPPPKDVLFELELVGKSVPVIDAIFDALDALAALHEGMVVERYPDPCESLLYCVVRVYEALVAEDYAACLLQGLMALWLDSKAEGAESFKIIVNNLRIPPCRQWERLNP